MAATDHLFHVVCRDCPTESLADSEHDARAFADRHRSESEHTVDFDKVA